MINKEYGVALGINHCDIKIGGILSDVEFNREYRKRAPTEEELSKTNEDLFKWIMMRKTFVNSLIPKDED